VVAGGQRRPNGAQVRPGRRFQTERYRQVIAEWLAAGCHVLPPVNATVTINELCLAFW
jgi:hypothetical protein